MKRVILFSSLIILVSAGVAIYLVSSINLPNLNNLNERKVAQSTKIYDRTGQVLLYDIHGTEKRTVVPFDEIPRNVKNATIALEDDTFYSHYGVRPFSILRALFFDTLTGGSVQGGSTITQQLVKNVFLTSQKTIIRKVKELVLALKVENQYSKDEILNLYLNQIPYGNGAYGVEAAAETFFGKNAKDLTLRESVYLAALPRATSFYSPYGKNKDKLEERVDFALNKMKDLGFISSEEYDNGKKEKVVFTPNRAQGIIAPHFVLEVKQKLDEMFGQDVVEQGGFKVTTTLDADLEQKSEETVKKYADINEKNFNAKNEAVVAIDPKTGDVLSMVGSRDYFDQKIDGNFNVATAHRQPGSSFKPFVYATAFKKGYTPDTVLFDVPTEFNPSCSPDGAPPAGVIPDNKEDKCYHPQNFDEKFRGPITLRESIAQSLNVPSVKVLYLAGIADSLRTAKDFGITSLNDPERYGLTLVLGGGEVSPLELTSAYGVFADDGVRNNYREILKVEDANGKTVFEPELNSTEVIDKNIARTISDVLSDDKARAGEFPILHFPGREVAAKTGTTNDYRDAWVIGYTPSITIGAWAGNNDNTPMAKKVAGFIVAPMWHEIMDYALTRLPQEEFMPPDPLQEPKPVLRGEWRGGIEYIIDQVSGKLATEYTPKESQEKKVIQQVHSILFWLNKDNPLGDAPIDPSADPQFKNWEAKVREWALTNGLQDKDVSVEPKDYDNVHIPNKMPVINNIDIIPQKNSYNKNDIIFIRPEIVNSYEITQLDYFLNDQYLGSIKKSPFEFGFRLSDKILQNYQTINLKIKIYDKVNNTTEKSIEININQT